MKRLAMALVAISCGLVLALAGCSGGSGGGDKKVDAESLKGVWALDTSTELGFNVVINLDEEDFAEMLVGDSYLDGTWTTDGSEAKLTMTDREPATIYVEGDKLIVGSDSGSRLVFTKSPDEMYDEAAMESEYADLTDEELEELGLEDEPEDVNINDIEAVPVTDDELCSIVVDGKGVYEDGDSALRVVFTNKSDKTLDVDTGEGAFTVDGQAIDGYWDGESIVEPGQTVTAYIYFDVEELGGGVEKLKNVKGSIAIYDDESESEDVLTSYEVAID